MDKEKLTEQDEHLPKEPSTFFSTRFIRFLGGKNLLFLLIVLLLLGGVILIFDQISFIFEPLHVLFQVIILPGVLGVILYYLLRPILRQLMKWRVPKIWSILIIFILVIGALTLLVLLVYPFLRDQFTKLAQEFPNYFMAFVDTTIDFVNSSKVNDYLNNANIDINKMLEEMSADLVNTVRDTFSAFASNLATGITTFVSKATGILLSLVIVPFILFYLLYEGEKMPRFILRLFPPTMRGGVSDIMSDMDKQISSYIQGQIIVSICIGIMMTIGFNIIGLPYAFLLGFIAMITSVVPYLGPAIAITPALIIALVESPIMVIWLGLVWTIVQLIEGKFISPQIMGKSLHIHPITIIFVLLCAGSLFGVAGILIGIPGYAIMKVLVTHLYRSFKQRYNKFQTVETRKYEDV